MPVNLPEDDREHLLEEMRGFLVYTTATLNAAIEGDMTTVQRLAEQVRPPLERARMLASGDHSPAPPMTERNSAPAPADDGRRHHPSRFERMRRNLPQPFRVMMLQMREGIAEVGRDAVTRNDPLHSLRQLHRVQEVCIACHQAYRLESGSPDAAGQP